MTHGGRDRTRVLACFDDDGPAVFATLCHLTAGDHQRALALLVSTFTRFLPPESTAYESAGGSLDRRSMIVAAHRCYLADPDVAGGAADGAGPIAGLSPIQRAVLNLGAVESMSSPEINFALRIAEVDAEQIAVSAQRHVSDATFGRPVVETFTACEVWFDDVMRSRCRADIDRALADHVVSTDTDGIPVQRPRARLLTVGASVAAAAIAVVAIGAWLAPSGDSKDTNLAKLAAPTTVASTGVSRKDPSELPDPANTTATTAASEAVAAGGPMPSADDGAYVLDPPPAGFVGTGGRVDAPASSAPNWLEVWSSAGATRTDGRWLAITVVNDLTAQIPILPDAKRRTLAGRPAITSVDGTGVNRVVVSLADGRTIYVQMFGIDQQVVEELIGSTTVAPNGTVEHTPGFDAAVDGMELVSSGPTADNGFASAVSAPARHRATYQTTDGAHQIDVITTPQVANDMTVSRLLTPPPEPAELYDERRMIVVNTSGALVGDLEPAANGTASTATAHLLFAEWHEGTRTITVTGRLPIGDLIEAARSARLSSAAEWNTLTATKTIATPDAGFAFRLTSVGTMVTTGDDAWAIALGNVGTGIVSIQEQRRAHPASTELAPGGVSALFAVTPDVARPLLQYATFDATIVIVVFETPAPAAALRVVIGDRSPIDLPLAVVDDPAWSAAAYVFSEDDPYSVSLLDPTGAVIKDLVAPAAAST